MTHTLFCKFETHTEPKYSTIGVIMQHTHANQINLIDISTF